MSFPANPYNEQCWIVGSPVIGEGTWIGAFTLIDGQGGLVIGRGCDISCGVQILTHSTAQRCISERQYQRVDRAPTTIGDFVFIGTNAVVLMGSQIGHHSVIAAGAVVLENTVIEPFSLWAGVPAKFVRSLERDVAALKKGQS